MAPGSGASVLGYFFRKSATTWPLGLAQYWVMPCMFSGPVQWVSARCVPVGNSLPSVAFQGAAMR